MSTRLTKALEFANYRTTLNNQKEQLKAKTQSLLSFSINGGSFTIDLPLLTFCKQLLDDNQTEVVLLDIYNNPIKVELEKFYEEILSRYYEVTNDYYVEYEKLRKARKVHKVLDLNEEGK
tara:strand:+ start:3964 stop:4323 length:360 start_codon:yes stop_codon:yes gene_type:complete